MDLYGSRVASIFSQGSYQTRSHSKLHTELSSKSVSSCEPSSLGSQKHSSGKTAMSGVVEQPAIIQTVQQPLAKRSHTGLYERTISTQNAQPIHTSTQKILQKSTHNILAQKKSNILTLSNTSSLQKASHPKKVPEKLKTENKRTFQVFVDENSIPECSPSPIYKSTGIFKNRVQSRTSSSSSVSQIQDGLDYAFRSEVYEYSLYKETITRPDANYIRRQKEIKQDMRTVLVDWLMEVSYSSQTYHCSDVVPLAVNYMDRFLSKMGVPRSKFQLLGIVCLMVASKMTDTIPPDTIHMSELTDSTYTSTQIKKMELILLQNLQFDLYPPVPASFFSHYLTLSSAAPDIDATPQDTKALPLRTYSSLFCHFLTELTTLDYRLSVSWLISQISLCTVLLLRLIIKQLLENKPFFGGDILGHLVEHFLTKEQSLVEDVKCYGVLSPELKLCMKQKDTSSNSEVINTMLGIRTLWRGVITQDPNRNDACMAVLEKFNRDTMLEIFPDLSYLCQRCIPSNQDIEHCLI